MIRKNLLQLLFSGSCIWRWNDKLRPVELSEIDKQAHKMLVAFPLAHEQAIRLQAAEARKLYREVIEGALFDYLYRLVITDIKPPVFYKIKENPDHYQKLTAYVLKRLEPTLQPLGAFWERMKIWHENWQNNTDSARRILSAAHLFASQWEFKLIKPHNPFDEEIEYISRSFEDMLDEYADLPGLAQIRDPSDALGKFANLCGQLRFQVRWTQVPRVPATTVLGHTFMVAALAYLYSLNRNSSQIRANNNFFTGLFHDFPELLTRDIISPVKSSVPELSQIIKNYEESELQRRILSPLREAGFESLTERISFFLGLEIGSEFQESCLVDGHSQEIADYRHLDKIDSNRLDPKDGRLIKLCDLLAAFLEAHNSIATGISSSHLYDARARLKRQLIENSIEGMNLEALLADFD